METTELIRYRRALKRKNYSSHTVKSYLNILDQFIRWLTVPLADVTRWDIDAYEAITYGKLGKRIILTR